MGFAIDDKLRHAAAWSALVLGRVEKMALLSIEETALTSADCAAVFLCPGGVVVATATRRWGRVEPGSERLYPVSHGDLPSPSETADALERHGTETGRKISSVVLALPKEWYVARKANLPAAVTDEDLPRVLRYELDRLTPLPPDGAFFDHRVLGRNEHLQVFLVAGSRAKIAPYVDHLRVRGIAVTRLTPGLLGWRRVCSGEFLGACTAVIDLSPERPELLRLGEGEEMTFTSLSVPEASPQAWFDALPVDASTVLWAGYGIRARHRMEEILEPFLVSSGVKMFGPAAPADGPARDDTVRTGTVAKAVPGGAMALAVHHLKSWRNGSEIDLMHSEKKPEQTSRGLGLTFVLVLVMIGLFGMAGYLPIRDAHARLASLQQQSEELKPQVEAVQKMERQLASVAEEGAALRRFKREESAKLLILKELSEITPANTWVNSLNIKGSTVEISGYSDSATDLLGLLERSKLVEQVEFSSPTVRDRRQNADRFKIKARVETAEQGAHLP